MARQPTLQDLDFGSVRSAKDLQVQADILAQIANIKYENYKKDAPAAIKDLEAQGVSPAIVLSAIGTAMAGIAVFIAVKYGTQLLSVFVSVMQPLYYTYIALETDTKDDDTVWLTYWMVHGILYLAEHTILVPINQMVPAIYYISKIVLQVWMVNFEGATVIYEKGMAPFFRRNEDKFNATIEHMKEEVMEAVGMVEHEHEE